MSEPRPVAEPLFWVSLLVGIIGFPLLVWGRSQGLDGEQVLFGSLTLLGAAGFGFGSTLLVAAYGDERLHPPLVFAAASGALAGGAVSVFLAADLFGGLRIFAFIVLVVDAVGLAASPRAWRQARAAPPNAEATQ